MTTQAPTDTFARLANLQRELREPAVLNDANKYAATKVEAERLAAIAELEMEQAHEMAKEEDARRHASESAKLAEKRREAVQRGTIDADLDAIATSVSRALLDAETRLEDLHRQHLAGFADTYRLGTNPFKPSDETGGRPRDGAPTHFPRLPDAIERVRVLVMDRVTSAGQPEGHPPRYDRPALNFIPR